METCWRSAPGRARTRWIPSMEAGWLIYTSLLITRSSYLLEDTSRYKHKHTTWVLTRSSMYCIKPVAVKRSRYRSDYSGKELERSYFASNTVKCYTCTILFRFYVSPQPWLLWMVTMDTTAVSWGLYVMNTGLCLSLKLLGVLRWTFERFIIGLAAYPWSWGAYLHFVPAYVP